MEKAPLPAQPREGAKSLLRFLVTQNNIKRIAEGEEGLIRGAPFNAMQEYLGDQPSLETMVELLEVALKVIGEHAEQAVQSEQMEKLRVPKMERIGRMVEYIVKELSNEVAVHEYHPSGVVPWNLGQGITVGLPTSEHEQKLTGEPLAKRLAIELKKKQVAIGENPQSLFASELAKRLERLAAG